MLRFLLLLLNGRTKDLDSKQKDIVLILFLWAFLPMFVLSFSSIKEVTYILPSYAAIAIMVGGWFDERLRVSDTVYKGILCFATIVIPIGIASFTLAPINPKLYLIIIIVWMSLFLFIGIISLIMQRFSNGVLIVYAVLSCLVIMLNTPEIMRTTALKEKCYFEMAKDVFDRVGDKALYIYGGSETLLGAMPFYGKRHVPVIKDLNLLKQILSSGENDFVIMVDNCFNRLTKDKGFATIFKKCKISKLPYSHLNENYILVMK